MATVRQDSRRTPDKPPRCPCTRSARASRTRTEARDASPPFAHGSPSTRIESNLISGRRRITRPRLLGHPDAATLLRANRLTSGADTGETSFPALTPQIDDARRTDGTGAARLEGEARARRARVRRLRGTGQTSREVEQDRARTASARRCRQDSVAGLRVVIAERSRALNPRTVQANELVASSTRPHGTAAVEGNISTLCRQRASSRANARIEAERRKLRTRQAGLEGIASSSEPAPGPGAAWQKSRDRGIPRRELQRAAASLDAYLSGSIRSFGPGWAFLGLLAWGSLRSCSSPAAASSSSTTHRATIFASMRRHDRRHPRVEAVAKSIPTLSRAGAKRHRRRALRIRSTGCDGKPTDRASP